MCKTNVSIHRTISKHDLVYFEIIQSYFFRVSSYLRENLTLNPGIILLPKYSLEFHILKYYKNHEINP